jgi:hypothetical protein
MDHHARSITMRLVSALVDGEVGRQREREVLNY